MVQRVREMRAEGVEVLALTAGEPDFTPPRAAELPTSESSYLYTGSILRLINTKTFLQLHAKASSGKLREIVFDSSKDPSVRSRQPP